MAELEAPPKYDENTTGNVNTPALPPTTSKPIIVTLNYRQPGNITSEDGKQMTIGLGDKALLRQTHDAVNLASDLTRKELLTLLTERVEAHFKVDLSRLTTFSRPSVVVGGKRVTVVDDIGWEAVRGWLLDGTGSLQVDFATVKEEVPKEKRITAGASKEEASKVTAKDEKTKRKRCVVQ